MVRVTIGDGGGGGGGIDRLHTYMSIDTCKL